jgi:hypothetical protein
MSKVVYSYVSKAGATGGCLKALSELRGVDHGTKLRMRKDEFEVALEPTPFPMLL